MVFISYKSADEELAKSLCNELEGQGITCWIAPRDIQEGTDDQAGYGAAIEDGIMTSDGFLILYSTNVYAEPTQVRQELYLANERQKAGLTIFVANLDSEEELPSGFRYVFSGKHHYAVQDATTHKQLVDTIVAIEKFGAKQPKDNGEPVKQLEDDPDYLAFAAKTCRQLYDDPSINWVSYQGFEFPDAIVPAADEARGFDTEGPDLDIQARSHLTMEDPVKDEIKQSPAAFTKCLLNTIPVDQYGFMNKQVLVNEDNEITGFEMFPAHYSDNAYTTLALRTELENTYRELADKGPVSTEDVLEYGPQRNALYERFHGSLDNLLHGDYRYSQFGLQAVVLFKNDDPQVRSLRKFRGQWLTPLMFRSDEVNEQKGFYQFAPCGSFAIYADRQAELAEGTAKRSFSMINALLLKYCQELFCDVTNTNSAGTLYIPPEAGKTPWYALEKSPHYNEMLDMLEDGRAEIEFLGLSSSMVALSSDIVFAIVIHDGGYINRNYDNFKGDYEASSFDLTPMSFFDSPDHFTDTFRGEEIAGPLALLKRSHLYKKWIEPTLG